MLMTHNDFARRVHNNKSKEPAKYSVLKRIILLGLLLAITLSISSLVLEPLIPAKFLSFVQIAQFAIICYFVMELISNSALDRKSTRLNSSHANISYAVFC